MYQCYQALLDGSAGQEVDSFLNEQVLSTYGKVGNLLHDTIIHVHIIYYFCQKIDKFRALSDELALLRQTAYLNLFSLDCKELNLLLAKKAMDLAERLVAALVVKNRDLNKEYVPVIMRTTTTTMTIAPLFIAVFVIAMTTYQTRFMKILGAQRRWCS